MSLQVNISSVLSKKIGEEESASSKASIQNKPAWTSKTVETIEKNGASIARVKGTKIYPEGTYEGDLVNGVRDGRGNFFFLNKDVFEGEYANDRANGWGRKTFANGTDYTGYFKDDECDGEGVLESAVGDRYEGAFKNDEFDGRGKLWCANGDYYEGMFKDGLTDGEGTLRLANGDSYEGTFKEGQFQKGFLRRFNGDLYEGTFKEGLFDGKGTLRWANGDSYEGAFKGGLRNGEGTLKFASGACYTGSFKEHLFDGKGVFVNAEGRAIQGNFHEHKYISGYSNLSDHFFLHLLIGTQNVGGAIPSYPLGIISSFLLKNGYQELGEALASAYQHLQTSSVVTNQNAENLFQKMKIPGQTQLLCSGTKEHSIGIKISSSQGTILLEVYNSGEGKHPVHPADLRKIQTKYTVKYPVASLNPEILVRLIKGDFANVDEFYGALLKISGAEVVEQDSSSAIWQKDQKAENCSLEWIFAYLRNNMSQRDYDSMRLKLFTECSGFIQGKSDSESIKIKEELYRKIEKRNLRLRIFKELNERKQSAPSPTPPQELSLKLKKKRKATNRKAVSTTSVRDCEPMLVQKRGEKRHRGTQARILKHNNS